MTTEKFVVLRDGSNGWYCSPDALETPGPDPWCYDQTWLDWVYAFLAGEEPNIAVPGLAYKLQGSSDASNTNPFATEPAAGEEWMTTPPLVKIILPGELDQAAFSTDHHSGEPWIMWAGLPRHLMMPWLRASTSGKRARSPNGNGEDKAANLGKTMALAAVSK